MSERRSEGGAWFKFAARFGDPVSTEFDGVELFSYEVDPEGDGIVLLRSACQGDGSNLVRQWLELEPVLAVGPARPRFVLALWCSGALAFEERADLRFVDAAIRAGLCRWLAVADFSRVARDRHVWAEACELLRRTGTLLLCASPRRPLTDPIRVEEQTEEPLLPAAGMPGMVDEAERALIAARTRRGQIEFADRGHGWPGRLRLGFCRDPRTRRVEVDPVQWRLVRFLHERFEEAGSLRALARWAEAEHNATLTPRYVGRILRDRIYVEGVRPPVRTGGREIVCLPVFLPDPIPQALFERNQELLDGGGRSITP
jgi:DNA invertase Pin-like site-specific DNA recombinase